MGQQNTQSILIKDDDPQFHDALDEFPEFDPSLSISKSSSITELDSSSNNNATASVQSKLTPEPPSSAGLRRRSLVEFPRSNSFKSNPYLVDFDSHVSTISSAKNYKVYWDLKDHEKLDDKLNRTRVRVSSGGGVGKRLNQQTNENSTITSANGDDENTTADSPNSGSNFIFTLAGLVVKAIGFQASLLFSCAMFPIWLMYASYIFIINPFAATRRVKRYMFGKLSSFLEFCYGGVKRVVYFWVKKNESTWRLCLRMGWGLLWSAYVGFVLVGLLVLAFVVSAVMMRYVLEQPIQLKEQLNFDYTRDSPMAFVPIMSCREPSCVDCSEKIETRGAVPSRVIPLNHKLWATVSLTLPESDYNRKLGVFQVRVDFLSGNGKTLASTTQPCMLRFRSQPIRLLLTFLKLAPLLTGYSSETQTLDVKFQGYAERNVPTSCLRVVMEQRAEFAKGAGVPQIYTASVNLESQLPLLKRILWSWKVTLYVWTSILMFTIELLFTLICCTPFIAPRLRTRAFSSNNNASRNTHQGRR